MFFQVYIYVLKHLQSCHFNIKFYQLRITRLKKILNILSFYQISIWLAILTLLSRIVICYQQNLIYCFDNFRFFKIFYKWHIVNDLFIIHFVFFVFCFCKKYIAYLLTYLSILVDKNSDISADKMKLKFKNIGNM